MPLDVQTCYAKKEERITNKKCQFDPNLLIELKPFSHCTVIQWYGYG